MPKRRGPLHTLVIIGVLSAAALAVLAFAWFWIWPAGETRPRPFTTVTSIAGPADGIGEPFGVAVKGDDIFISDGLHGKIWRLSNGSPPIEFASGLHTPSAIAFDSNGDLIVADTGSHTIKKVNGRGAVSIIAGTEGQFGDIDGPAVSARLNAPVGVAILGSEAIVVADTYNDKVKLIQDGTVTTIAGSSRGYAEGTASNAKFDTPCGVAVLSDGTILVADTMNGLLRKIDEHNIVSTLVGHHRSQNPTDGSLTEALFDRPYSIASGPDGSLFIGDANSVRMIANSPLPVVKTITDRRRGHVDAPVARARFNRVSGVAVTGDYQVIIADSDNASVRTIYSAPAGKADISSLVDRTKRTDPAEFRSRQPARWPYDPPYAARDIAGTLGEIRYEYTDEYSRPRFHNGLDIAGTFGEKARFLRDEKVLTPLSAENFDTLRELIRLPTVGYIHIRLGRDSSNRPLGDSRFQFDTRDMGGIAGIIDVRVRRGTEFKAGEVIGTLNAMNHVHMIAGPAGDEMNALAALILPGVTDTIPPIIEEVTFFDQNWLPVETKGAAKRITVASNTRVVVRAFDRMDGNPERRRLGVYRLGYQLLNGDHSAVTDVNWNISFDRNPSPDAVKTAYAIGSKSGPTGETIFRYIVTNKVSGESFGEGFLDPGQFAAGEYVLRVFAADYFGNTTSKDISFEVAK